jgi:hypothetical protein
VGSPLSELDEEEATFFKTDYIAQSKRDTALVPINGYYGSTFPTQNKTGELVKWVNLSTLGVIQAKAFQIIKGFTELVRGRNALGFVEVQRDIRIRFKDIYAENHIEFYEIDSMGKTVKLSDEQGRRVFQEWEDGLKNNWVLDLDKYTPEKLLENFFAIMKERAR